MKDDDILEIVKYGDEVLRKRSEKVTEIDDALRLLLDAMMTTLRKAEGVGLAAPQIGINKRFFVVDVKDVDIHFFINPEIVETSMESGPYDEGCLSLPGVFREVQRPVRVKVQYQDEFGKVQNIEARGLLARVIQHENDHLDGKMFIDRLPEDAKEDALREYERKSKRRKKK